jgi:hypothetical protein
MLILKLFLEDEQYLPITVQNVTSLPFQKIVPQRFKIRFKTRRLLIHSFVESMLNTTLNVSSFIFA